MTEVDAGSDAPWLTLAEAAARSGRHIDALRTMARRGKLERRKGNAGQWLVRLPPHGLARSDRGEDVGLDQGMAEVVAELREEVTELRIALARSEAGHDAGLAQARAERDAALATAAAKVEAIERAHLAEIAAKEALLAELRSVLADVRRPWWRRWLGR